MRVFGCVILAGGFSVLAGLSASAETLSDALIAAYRNSNLLEQNQAVLRAADEGVAQATAMLRPVLDYSLSMGLGRTDITGVASAGIGLDQSLALNASMMIHDFGRSDLGIKIAKENVLATRQSLANIEQDVLLSAVSAYISLGLQSQTLALRQSNTRLIAQELRAVTDRLEVGDATRTDVAQAESLYASAQASEQAVEGSVTLAREAYQARIGHAPSSITALPAAPALPASVEAAKAIALRSHPLILQANSLVKSAELQVEMAKANFAPMISGSASLSASFSEGARESLSQNLGIAMTQTIYSGGLKASTLREAIAGAESARAAARETGIILSESVGRAWSSIEVAVANIQSTEKQIRAAQAAFDGVKEEADLGARTTLDVLDAEQNLLDARFAKLQAEAQLYEGSYQLLSTMGLLNVAHLNLGIATYDVEAYFDLVKKAPAHSAQGAALERILASVGP